MATRKSSTSFSESRKVTFSSQKVPMYFHIYYKLSPARFIKNAPQLDAASVIPISVDMALPEESS